MSAQLVGERVLVTGAAGSLGSALVPALRDAGASVYATDVDEMDVRDVVAVETAFAYERPSLVFHLAAAKHAPEGETEPRHFVDTNVDGTANVLDVAEQWRARVILASSCKACDPETVYGASKLIAERMVLNAGGSVARFFNIPESSGNVFELWRSLPDDVPIPVTACSRYFITLEQAVGLLLAAIVFPPGRYCVDPGPPRRMVDVAAELYPGRVQREIPPRRGDRLVEPLCASHERLFGAGILRVESDYDPVPAREAVAA